MNMLEFIDLPVKGHLDYVQFWATTNKAAMNICI